MPPTGRLHQQQPATNLICRFSTYLSSSQHMERLAGQQQLPAGARPLLALPCVQAWRWPYKQAGCRAAAGRSGTLLLGPQPSCSCWSRWQPWCAVRLGGCAAAK